MPATRSPRSTRGRRAGLVVGLLALGATAACGTTGSDTPANGISTTTSTLLAPWQGTFTTSSLPAPVQTLRAVACASASRCFAVGSTAATATVPSGPVVMATTNGGRTWTLQSLPPGLGYLSGIACATARACTAVGQAGGTGVGPGAVVTTTDGGSTWTSQAVPTGTTDVTAVDCRPRGSCTALGTVDGHVATLAPAGAGGAWAVGGPLPPAASSATSLSCTDDEDCWATTSNAVDSAHAVGGIASTSDGGAAWAFETVPVGTGQLNAVTCSRASAPSTSTSTTTTGTAASCTAVGTTSTVINGTRVGQGIVLTSANGGVTWGSAPVSPTAADLLDVSCGAGPCVAVGSSVATAVQAGVVVLTPATGASAGIWRRAVTAPEALPLTGVSCVSLASCVVVGESVSARLTSSA